MVNLPVQNIHKLDTDCLQTTFVVGLEENCINISRKEVFYDC